MTRRPAAARREPRKLSAVEKALRIIEAVAAAQAPIGMAEVERRTGLARPTAHRVTNTLIGLRYIERDLRLRHHSEGPKLVNLALDVLRSGGPRDKRREILSDVARLTGEACYFGLLRGDQILLVERVDSPAPLGVRYNADEALPAHCTACGKLLLALLPKEECEAIVTSRALTRHTVRTIIDRRRLALALAGIRAAGIGTEDGEHIAGVTAIAVPVQLKGARVVGALGLAAPQARVGLPQARKLVPTLKTAAARLAATFDAGAAA